MTRFELWVEVADQPGNLAALAGDLAACGANIVDIDIHAGDRRSGSRSGPDDRSAGDDGDTVIDRLVVQAPDARERDLAEVARRNGGQMRRLDGGGKGSAPKAHIAAALRPAALPPSAGSSPRPPTTPVRRIPVTLERLVALADGGLVRLRNLGAGDHRELAAHHARCSDATRRHSRFLTAVADIEARAADGHVALVAMAGGAIVGAARYELADGGRRAEVSVIVEDAHQRRGIGSLLVAELAALAVNAGVTRLRAVAPAGGDALARTLRHGGLHYAMHRQGEALVLDCSLPHGFSATA